MSELDRMAAVVVTAPLRAPSPVAVLHRRNRRRRWRRVATGAVAMALVAAAVTVTLQGPTGPTDRSPRAGGSHLASYIRTGVSVPQSVLDAVGLPSEVNAPMAEAGPPLTATGRVVVAYVGGDYCPFCAVARWSLLVALSRFGTFDDLGQVVSSASTDVYPGLQSWSFHGSVYSSTSVAFEPAEEYSGTRTPTGDGYEPLDALNPTQQQAMQAYDGSKSIPFVDVGNRYVQLGAAADPSVLEGLSLDQVAADLGDPSSPVAQAIDGSANYLIAAVCAATGGAGGAAACSSPVVSQAQAAMDSTGGGSPQSP